MFVGGNICERVDSEGKNRLKTIIFFVFSLFASDAFSQLMAKKTCIAENGKCFIAAVRLEQPSGVIYLPDDMIKSNSPAIQAYRDLGYGVSTLTPSIDAYYASISTPVETVSVATNDGILSSIPDEQWDMWGQGVACGVTVTGCAAATFYTIETFGLLFWVAEAECVAAAWGCADFFRKWEKWQVTKSKIVQEKKKAEAVEAGHDSSGGVSGPGGDSSVPSRAISPGRPGTLIECNKIPGGVVSVTEGGVTTSSAGADTIICKPN